MHFIKLINLVYSNVMKTSFARRIIFDKSLWWLRHVLYWLCYVIVFSLFSFTSGQPMGEAIITTSLWLPVHFVYTYFVIYWLVPHYLIKEKYGLFFLFYCCWALAGLLINFAFRAFVLIPFRTGRPVPVTLSAVYREIFAIFSFVVMNSVSMFATFIKMFKFWYGEQKQKLQAEEEKVRTELQLLKSQLHPHFLFNTLNNLYALVNERSGKAPAMLLRLSGLLSYVLYECRADEVPLEKEIVVIKDYVALEQERYGDRLDISLNFSGDIEGRMIPPMLFQPFVENAFKHGTAEQLGKVWMSIDLSVKNNQLLFKLINSFDGTRQASVQGGVGISNIRKRLSLLYPQRFQLQTGHEGELYIVSMTIDLPALTANGLNGKKVDNPKKIPYEDTVPGYR